MGKRNERICEFKRQRTKKDVFFLYHMPEMCRILWEKLYCNSCTSLRRIFSIFLLMKQMAKTIKEEDRQRRQREEAVRSGKGKKKSSYNSRIFIIIGAFIMLA